MVDSLTLGVKVRVRQPRFEGDVGIMGFGRKNWKIGKLEYEKW